MFTYMPVFWSVEKHDLIFTLQAPGNDHKFRGEMFVMSHTLPGGCPPAHDEERQPFGDTRERRDMEDVVVR